ncbi:MAG: hypothetical protein KKB51_07120 [Candidatus Riflebacteria bacterium]|nr:hypothetical protein [Candidatus Riflebacteria bacterium]
MNKTKVSDLPWAPVRAFSSCVSGAIVIATGVLAPVLVLFGKNGKVTEALLAAMFIGIPMILAGRYLIKSSGYRVNETRPALLFTHDEMINPDESLGFKRVLWSEIEEIEAGGWHFKGVMIRLTEEGKQRLSAEKRKAPYPFMIMLPQRYQIFISILDVGKFMTDARLKEILLSHWETGKIQRKSLPVIRTQDPQNAVDFNSDSQG